MSVFVSFSSMQQNVFNHISIIGKYGADHVGDTIARVLNIIDARGIQATLDLDTMPETLRSHPLAKPMSAWSDDIDLAVVIGGDGTFLHAGRELIDKGIPLLGINSGRLGFLADLPLDELETQLNIILNGQFFLERRQTLKVEVLRQGQKISKFYAINDAVVHKRTMARMVELDVFIADCFLSHYRADGLIISTPTGSTAYALSAGGPIVEPSLGVTLIVPICPHTLTQRPVVINAHCHITIDISKNSFKDIQITIDGQKELILELGDKILVSDGAMLPVIHLADYRFQDRLRHKLNWGLAPNQIISERYA